MVKQNPEKGLPLQGNQLLEFLGVRLDKLAGYSAIVTEYRRSGPQGPVWVQLNQVFTERQELSINFSYREPEAEIWKAVVGKMRQSITLKPWT